MTRFSQLFIAAEADIDELGHVNNAVWVRWIQDIAVAHWHAVATPEQAAAYVWVIVRHEIDYRGNLRLGDSIAGETWVADPPRGATFERRVAFMRDGRAIVEAKTRWAVLDRATLSLVRVPRDVSERFLPSH